MAGRLRAPDVGSLTRASTGPAGRPPLSLPLPAPTGTPGSGPESSAAPPGRVPLPADFFTDPVEQVARALLGTVLESRIGGDLCSVVVVEVEAYGGADDPASHAATRTGVTDRNRVMFGPAGRAYVYRSYGVHWCLNVVTGHDGDGQAVLLRGGLPLEGVSEMRTRRAGREPLAAGPGRLAQALGVTGAQYGHDLTEPPLCLLPGWWVGDEQVGVSSRIGITRAADWPCRFYVRGAPGVSGRPR